MKLIRCRRLSFSSRGYSAIPSLPRHIYITLLTQEVLFQLPPPSVQPSPSRTQARSAPTLRATSRVPLGQHRSDSNSVAGRPDRDADGTRAARFCLVCSMYSWSEAPEMPSLLLIVRLRSTMAAKSQRGRPLRPARLKRTGIIAPDVGWHWKLLSRKPLHLPCSSSDPNGTQKPLIRVRDKDTQVFIYIRIH